MGTQERAINRICDCKKDIYEVLDDYEFNDIFRISTSKITDYIINSLISLYVSSEELRDDIDILGREINK